MTLSYAVVVACVVLLGPAAAGVAERLIACLGARLDRRAPTFLLADSAVHGVVAGSMWLSGLLWVYVTDGVALRGLRGIAIDAGSRFPPLYVSLVSGRPSWAFHGLAAESTLWCAIIACLLDLDHFVVGWWYSDR